MLNSPLNVAEAEAALAELASVFFREDSPKRAVQVGDPREQSAPDVEARYRALVEQIPAVVFMASLDEGTGEAYVSPQIERDLGFTQREWLEDPVRWYQQIHPDDKQRWSEEASQLLISDQRLRSAYRVLSRDGRVIWFHCEAEIIRSSDGRPWFIHGVAFDITEQKQAEAALAEERDLLSAILDTVVALIAVLDAQGRIVRFNRSCERTTGYSFAEVRGRQLWDLFLAPEESVRFQAMFGELIEGTPTTDYESVIVTREGDRRLINWSVTVLPGSENQVRHVIATGIDITERKRLERAVLEVSDAEQRRIGQDLHDGLGQHLTGIAFMGKVLEQGLAERSLPEAAHAAKIVALVNEGIHQTRELARGLLPVSSDPGSLMNALRHWAGEVDALFRIHCRFECPVTVLIDNRSTANHLYRIAQEAVHNAIRHGKAANVTIELVAVTGRAILSIRDDGCGIAVDGLRSTGMGLGIMRYRAGMIGGVLEVVRDGERGTLVVCNFPND